MQNDHNYYLNLALQEAASRRGFCAPNPAVGAIVVKDNKVLATGKHWACGYTHAEVDALKHLQDAKGATVYVTLEPCCHTGRTPPCTDLLIERGVAKIYYGLQDVNPQVAGKGAQQLRDAGVVCELIELEAIQQFYHSYRYWWQHQMPFVTAKIAVSKNNKYASNDGAPIAITGKACQEYTHQCRSKSDAILTTTETVLHDDPKMNVRLGDEVIAKPIYLLDSQCRLPLTARLFSTAESITVFHANSAPQDRIDALMQAGVRCVAVQEDSNGLCLPEVLQSIGKEGVHDLWVEAGGRCVKSLLKQNLCQQLYVYQSSSVLDDGKAISFGKMLKQPDEKFPLGDDNVFICVPTQHSSKNNN